MRRSRARPKSFRKLRPYNPWRRASSAMRTRSLSKNRAITCGGFSSSACTSTTSLCVETDSAEGDAGSGVAICSVRSISIAFSASSSVSPSDGSVSLEVEVAELATDEDASETDAETHLFGLCGRRNAVRIAGAEGRSCCVRRRPSPAAAAAAAAQPLKPCSTQRSTDAAPLLGPTQHPHCTATPESTQHSTHAAPLLGPTQHPNCTATPLLNPTPLRRASPPKRATPLHSRCSGTACNGAHPTLHSLG